MYWYLFKKSIEDDVMSETQTRKSSENAPCRIKKYTRMLYSVKSDLLSVIVDKL